MAGRDGRGAPRHRLHVRPAAGLGTGSARRPRHPTSRPPRHPTDHRPPDPTALPRPALGRARSGARATRPPSDAPCASRAASPGPSASSISARPPTSAPARRSGSPPPSGACSPTIASSLSPSPATPTGRRACSWQPGREVVTTTTRPSWPITSAGSSCAATGPTAAGPAPTTPTADLTTRCSGWTTQLYPLLELADYVSATGDLPDLPADRSWADAGRRGVGRGRVSHRPHDRAPDDRGGWAR